MVSRQAVDRFLEQRRIVVVGVSRDPKDFSRAVVRRLEDSGHEVVPVNPVATELEGLAGHPCHRSVTAVPGPVEAVLVMVPPDAALAVVDECIARGVPHVWLHRGGGQGSVSDEAVRRLREAGVDAVEGACPLMFAGRVRGIHRFHRWCVRGQVTA